MKRILLLISIAFCGVLLIAPEHDAISATPTDTDSTYTTFKTEVKSGYMGSDTCQHEWFTTSTNVEDTVNHSQTQITSRQCVKCGKQISTINTWTTYENQTDTTIAP